MSELSGFKKSYLKALAAEFGVELPTSDAILKIIRKIETLSDYEKEMSLNKVML